MQRLFKTHPFTNLKAEASGRYRAGIASVFGNVDAAGERVMPGAFAKTIAEGRGRIKHLWNHSWQHPPTAAIQELKELTRNELPDEVLAKAPDATGGLYVGRNYYDTELSNWILQCIDDGSINEMSFAYDVMASQIVTEPLPGDPEKSQEIRNLIELKAFDTSDVLWGCNSATVANGAKDFKGLFEVPFGVTAQQISAYCDDVKAGRRNASADLELIKGIHGMLMSLGYEDCMPKEETPKSERAGAVHTDTSLDLLKVNVNSLRFRAAVTTTLGERI